MTLLKLVSHLISKGVRQPVMINAHSLTLDDD